jgi:hypothetical protein
MYVLHHFCNLNRQRSHQAEALPWRAQLSPAALDSTNLSGSRCNQNCMHPIAHEPQVIVPPGMAASRVGIFLDALGFGDGDCFSAYRTYRNCPSVRLIQMDDFNGSGKSAPLDRRRKIPSGTQLAQEE